MIETTMMVMVAVLSESEAEMAWAAMQDMLAQCIDQLETSSGTCYSMHQAFSITRSCVVDCCCSLAQPAPCRFTLSIAQSGGYHIQNML